MKNLLEDKIYSKNLYLVTLRHVSHIGMKMFGNSMYFFGDKEYAFAKRDSNGIYVDVLTGTHYYFYDEPSLGSGDIAISKMEPINTRHLFVSKSVLKEMLKELNPVVESQKQFIKK